MQPSAGAGAGAGASGVPVNWGDAMHRYRDSRNLKRGSIMVAPGPGAGPGGAHHHGGMPALPPPPVPMRKSAVGPGGAGLGSVLSAPVPAGDGYDDDDDDDEEEDDEAADRVAPLLSSPSMSSINRASTTLGGAGAGAGAGVSTPSVSRNAASSSAGAGAGGSSDDDDDDDDASALHKSGWGTFTHVDDPSLSLYYNKHTREVSLGKVPESLARLPAFKAQTRRNSSILADAWKTPGGAGAGAGAGGRAPPPPPTALAAANAGASARPAADSTSGGAVKSSRELTADRAQGSLDVVSAHADVLAHSAAALSPQLADAVAALRKAVAAAQTAMVAVRSGLAQDEGSTVDALIGWRRLRWNFNASTGTSTGSTGNNRASISSDGSTASPAAGTNTTACGIVRLSAVDYYRVATRATDHAALAYQHWHAPQYFSQQPLLATAVKANCLVRLPPSERAMITQTKIEVGAEETVKDAIERALAKVPKGSVELLSADAYVLKVTGQRDYLVGDSLVFASAYVRKCLRDGADVELSLVPRPLSPAEGGASPYVDAHAEQQAAAAVAAYAAKAHAFPGAVPMTAQTHQDVPATGAGVGGAPRTLIPLSSIHAPFRARVVGVDGINADTLPRLASHEVSQVFVRACLFHGCQYLAWSHELASLDVAETVRWDAMLAGGYASQMSLLPRETRIGFVLTGRRADDRDKEVPLGWVTSQLVDHQGFLVQGRTEFRLWPFPSKEGKKGHGKKRDADPNFMFRAATVDNRSTAGEGGVGSGAAATLVVEFPRYALPVVAPLQPAYSAPSKTVVGGELKRVLDAEQSKQLLAVIAADPLFPLTPDAKQLLWAARHYLTDVPAALPKVMLCVPWGQQDHRNEAHRLLRLWTPWDDPLHALELLDARFADYTVRAHAVEQLRALSDEDLSLHLLQLVQCLKYEPYHDSPLARMLVERAIAAPCSVGHTLFWHLKAEVHDPLVCERFACLLEELLAHSGPFAGELRKQSLTVTKLQRVAEMVVQLKREAQMGDADATREYAKELEKLNQQVFGPMGKFQVPLNPRLEATTLIVEKCRYMSSKMVPLWLVFKNADPDAGPIYLIFKSGDDLRQDLLTLQLLRVMDKMWLAKGLDMRLKPYSVIATGVNDDGEGVGMIEVVLHSDTTSGIQLKYGGGAMGALKLDPIDLFIREHNKNEQLYTAAVHNFVRSCAGYCVATFVLGIGDRHNGNIMVTKSGHLFHIDFGHFLGNFKSKFGFKRERAAFVFTPEMAFVMGGKSYKKHARFIEFKKLCARAFRVLRDNASMLENLFVLMVAAGMPELMREGDIGYLRDKLHLELDAKGAVKALQSEISKSLENTSRRIDNYIHNLVHG